MSDQDLIYSILVRIEEKMDKKFDKMDEHIDKIEDKIEDHVCKVEKKIDTHRAIPHTVSLNAKQITALTGVLAVIFSAITAIAKMVIG